jgi:hypothetical protein
MKGMVARSFVATYGAQKFDFVHPGLRPGLGCFALSALVCLVTHRHNQAQSIMFT